MVYIIFKTRIEIISLVEKNNKLLINNSFYADRRGYFEYNCSICNNQVSLNYRKEKHQKLINKLCVDCQSKQTNINKYGVENPFQSEEIKNKIKHSKLEKYGNENYNNQEKIKQTNLEKYGVERPVGFNTKKYKDSILKKYGVNHVQKNKEINDKSKKTRLHKYGSYNNIKKIRQTNLIKYGSENLLESEIIQNKIKLSLFNKYNVDNPWKSNEIKEKIKLTKFIKFYNHLINSERLNSLVKPLFKIEEYQGITKKYQWQCCKCGNIFESNIDDGKIPRCFNCFPINTTSSNMEKEIVDWIKSLNIQVDENNRTLIHKELDIYIPSHNLAIEFDGLYWHSELQGKDANYHLDKTNRCSEKGIHLLHIFEDEWIEKQDIVKSIIKNNLGLHEKVVYGRNCIVKDISSKEANEFYDTNHIQGSCTSSINLGLYYQNELVSCLSFAKPRFNKKYDYEITRFANKLNYKVHGSFGKLWKHRPVGTIITYSDKRLFTGSIYKKYMNQLPDSKPAYWYVKNGVRYNRLEFQKHKLQEKLETFDVNLTEWENMQLNGYDRIWDCGNWVFKFK